MASGSAQNQKVDCWVAQVSLSHSAKYGPKMNDLAVVCQCFLVILLLKSISARLFELQCSLDGGLNVHLRKGWCKRSARSVSTTVVFRQAFVWRIIIGWR